MKACRKGFQEIIHYYSLAPIWCLQQKKTINAKKSREMDDLMSDLDNLDIMTGSETINPIDWKIAKTIGELIAQYDTESNSHPRKKSSQVKDFRDFGHENAIPRQDSSLKIMETTTNGINLRLSQEMDSMVFLMHSKINRNNINSARTERVIPMIQKMWSMLSSGNKDTDSCS